MTAAQRTRSSRCDLTPSKPWPSWRIGATGLRELFFRGDRPAGAVFQASFGSDARTRDNGSMQRSSDASRSGTGPSFNLGFHIYLFPSATRKITSYPSASKLYEYDPWVGWLFVKSLFTPAQRCRPLASLDRRAAAAMRDRVRDRDGLNLPPPSRNSRNYS